MKQQQKEQQIWVSFSNDILLKILSKLSVKSLLRFKCVCKSWNNLISDPYFAKLQLNQSIQDENLGVIIDALSFNTTKKCLYYCIDHDHEPNASIAEGTNHRQSTKLMHLYFKLWKSSDHHQTRTVYNTICGSCNGLILLRNKDFRIALWNPSTRDFKELPNVVDALDDDIAVKVESSSTLILRLGLGYDSTNDDYKVISIFSIPDHHSGSRTETHHASVYSLLSNTWRSSSRTIQQGNIINYENIRDFSSTGKYLNGAIHWLNSTFLFTGYDKEIRITYYEVGSEKWKWFEAPNPHQINEFLYLQLFVRRERLCIVCNYTSEDIAEIYEMREYGVKESWCKLSTISLRVMLGERLVWTSMLCVMKKGKWLLLRPRRSELLVLYDPKNCSLEEIKIESQGCDQNELHLYILFNVETYINSLVTLKPSSYYQLY